MSLPNSREVLFVGPDPTWFTVAPEPFRDVRTKVLRVAGIEHAIGAMRAGYDPDAILVDVTTDSGALWKLLRLLFDEPTWRHVPVLLGGGSADAERRSLFQIAPRYRQRRLPNPSDPKLMVALLHFVASEAEQDRESLAAP